MDSALSLRFRGKLWDFLFIAFFGGIIWDWFFGNATVQQARKRLESRPTQAETSAIGIWILLGLLVAVWIAASIAAVVYAPEASNGRPILVSVLGGLTATYAAPLDVSFSIDFDRACGDVLEKRANPHSFPGALGLSRPERDESGSELVWRARAVGLFAIPIGRASTFRIFGHETGHWFVVREV